MVRPSARTGARLKLAGRRADMPNVTGLSEGRKAAGTGVMELT